MDFPKENLIVGCMVLSSTQATTLPLFSQGALNTHVEGYVHGRVGLRGEFRSDQIWLPQKGQAYYMAASTPLKPDTTLKVLTSFDQGSSEGMESDSESRKVSGRLLSSLQDAGVSNGIICLEKRLPFGFIGISALDCELYLYGLHNQRVSVLYWTNLEPESFEHQLRLECGNSFWFYRFLPRKNLTMVLHTKRICSRWYRWGETPTMKDPSRRFQALEASLVNGALHHA